MFKRRKPDEAPNAPGAALPAGLPAGPAETSDEAEADYFDIPSSLPADSGLGVPPYRPAPPKEAPAMSRPPFPATPATPPASTPAARPGMSQASPARPVREPAERRTLVVGRGISLQGTVQDAERLVVEGTVEASMIHATELAIAHGGIFKGEVEVEEAEIAGTIDGTLTARTSLVVRASGRVLGTARCRRLQVEDGGQISGRIEMITGDAQAKPAESMTRPAVETAG